ncbi:glycosyltransferase family 92 protein [Phocaeicola faecalis]
MKKYFKYFKYLYFYNERIILPLKRSLNNWSYLVFILISPILIVNFVLSVIYEHTIGEILVHYQMKKDMKGSFVHDIAIVSISKNEGPYLLEWIEFHRIVGVTKFFFYDNDSDDNTRELLQPYIDSGIVDYVLVKGKGQQLNAYNDAIQKHKNECRWMAFIDMDEYLIPSQGGMLGETMQRLFEGRNDGAAGIGVNWATFGTSGHKNRLPPPYYRKIIKSC